MSDITQNSPAPVPEVVVGAAVPGSGVSAKPATKSGPPKLFGIDIRFIPPILITLILLVGQLTFGILESYPKTISAILTSLAMELILGKLIYGKWPHLSSAYVSGISVGILVRSPEYWPYILCSMISITSKYVIRWKGRHLWNPSNFGICVLLMFASDKVATLSIQWSNSIYPMIVVWIIGSLIVARLKRLHITATYAIAFVCFAFLRSAITHDSWQSEIAPITGPMYQLFLLFMITDPKSTLLTKKGQILVAVLVAAMECAFRLVHHFRVPGLDDLSVHAPYYALFFVGPIANAIEIWRNSRKTVSAGKV